MKFTTREKRALKILEPTVLNEPYMDFFNFLNVHRSDYKLNVERKKLYADFCEHVIEHISKTKFSRKKNLLKKSFDELLKKLNGIFWNLNYNHVEFQVSEEEWKDFHLILKQGIKSSDERKVRWIIYHLFIKGKRKISVSELEKYTKTLGIKSNLVSNIKKNFKDNPVSINIDFSNDIITINHKQDEPKINKFFIGVFGFKSKTSNYRNEEDILDYLDREPYSAKQISKMLGVSQSQLSPIFKKLRKEKEIELIDIESGEQFFMTNCENCYINLDRETCRMEAIDDIITTLKKLFGFDIPPELIDKNFDHNQSILQLRDSLTTSTRRKDSNVYPNFLSGLTVLYSAIMKNHFSQKQNPKAPRLIGMERIFSNLEPTFGVGFQFGQADAMSFIDLLLAKAGVKLTANQLKKVEKEAARQRNQVVQ